MVNTIGLRCYLVTAQRERDPAWLSFDDDLEFELTPERFLKNFIETHAEPVRDHDRERSWYFAPANPPAENGSSKGYIHYGTFGFESKIVNLRTRKASYNRKVDDAEEIPLFYEFWRPDDADYALMAFQSFGVRSCINAVQEKFKDRFSSANPGYAIRFTKLVPDDGSGGVYSTAPVKHIRLIKRNASADIADKYVAESSKPIDIELHLKARRNQSLGPFGTVSRKLKSGRAGGLITYEGVEFGEAIANIRIGGKYRPVGVFGSNADTGVIDLTPDVKKGRDGHPIYTSIEEQTAQILAEMNSIVGNRRR